MATVSNVNSRLAGIQNELMDMWYSHNVDWEKAYMPFVRTLKATTIRNAPYVWKESLPFPQKWPMGMPRNHQTFKDIIIRMPITPYELTIDYNLYDESDDQLGDLKTRILTAIKRYGLLAYTLFSEYLNGTAVENDSLHNAYDGAAIYSATTGSGANRLGASGGNIITGSGLTVEGVIADVARTQQRFLEFVDPTAGRVIFDYDMVSYDKMIVMGPPEANEVLQKASGSEMIKISGNNVVSESNYQKGTWEYRINNLLTDSSDLYVFLSDTYWKPFVHRKPKDIRTSVADLSNSDRAREMNEGTVNTDIRTQFAPWFPGVTIKINN